MRVLISDAHVMAALATVRSLGRHGMEPHVGVARGMFPLAAASRYCRGLVHLPDPATGPDDYADALLREVRRGYDAVLPLSDLAFTACAPARSEIERHAAYCAASPGALEQSHDKWALLGVAREAGFETPEARLVDGEAAWAAAAAALPPPTVHRARRSILRSGSHLIKPPTRVFFDGASAERDARQRIERGEPFVVSSYFPGTGRGIYLFMCSGEPVLRFGHLRIRETNPAGSASCAARPWMPTEDEIRKAATVLRALGVEGAAMLEFRQERHTGVQRMIEVNPRLWGSISLPVSEGLDIPRHQVEFFAAGRVPEMPPRLRGGAGVRYLSAEISRLLHAWQGPPRGWQADYPTFPAAWREFIGGFRDRLGYYVHDRSDPLPGVVDPLNYAATLWGSARRRRLLKARQDG